MKKAKTALVLSALLTLSACAENNDDNIVTESVTVSITEETAVTTKETSAVTSAETTKRSLLGDYTETAETTAAEEISGEEAAEEETIIIFGEEYPVKWTSFITVDAEKCSEVTDEDRENIKILQEHGLWYMDIKNCGSRDLSFLSEIEGIKSIRFWGAGGENFEWLSSFTELRSVGFMGFEGSAAALAEALEEIAPDSVQVYAKDFRLDDAVMFMERFGNKFACSYCSGEPYAEEEETPASTYAVCSACVDAFEGGIVSAYYDNGRFPKLRENNDVFTVYLCNPTDEKVKFESLEITDKEGNKLAFAGGSASLELGLEAAAGEELCFELTKDICPQLYEKYGVYKASFKCKDETVTCEFMVKTDKYSGLEELTEEQAEAFKKAHSYVSEYFGCSHFMSEEYAQSHTAEEFISQFTDAMTYELAEKFSGSYIGEDGKLRAVMGDRGSTLWLVDACFYSVRDESGVTVIPVTVNTHCDISRKNWFDAFNVHLTETPDGWRADRFTLWW